MCGVSIIIPVFNGQKFICECLDSIMRQDIVNKEIICIDDGSTDQTVNIIKSYQKYCKNIKLIQQPHLGAAIARNKGLEIAKGKYVAFMDADDFYMDSTGLRKLFEACEENNVPICGGFLYTMYNGKTNLADVYTDMFFDQQILRIRYEDIQLDYYYTSYIFKREFLNENELRFPNLSRYQDPPFLVQAMWIAKEFLILPLKLYCYRKHIRSVKFSPVQINDILSGIKLNVDFAKKHGLNILLSNNLSRLNKECLDVIKCSIMGGNLTALRILIEIYESLENCETKPDQKILALEEIKRSLRNPVIWFQNYIFPYSEMPFGSKIILYGAGIVGKYVYSVIKATQYCTIVKWVDRNYEEICKIGFDVCKPETIENVEADYILIAIEKEQVFEEIRKNIERNRWVKNRKIIGPIKKMEYEKRSKL